MNNTNKGILSVLIAAAIFILILITPDCSFGINWFLFKAHIMMDGLSRIFCLIASGLGTIILLYSIKYMDRESDLTRYYSLMLIFIASVVGVAISDNLLMLYFFWEITSICSYALIGYWYESTKNARSGLKALLITKIGDIAMLLGIILIFAYTGTLSITQLKLLNPGFTIIPFLFLLSALTKSAQFPFYIWLPDAMAGPTTVSSLIHSATLVNLGVYLIARMAPIFVNESYYIAISTLGLITAFLGAMLALKADDIKRMLAFSTMSQIGYMFLALGMYFYNTECLNSALSHLISHSLFKSLLFLDAGVILYIFRKKIMHQIAGLKSMKILFYSTLIPALALAAFPFTTGFWSKDAILECVLKSEFAFHNLFYFIGLLTAVITVFYIFKFINIVFLKQQNSKIIYKTPLIMSISLLILTSVNIILSIIWTISFYSHLNFSLIVSSIVFIFGFYLSYAIYIKNMRFNYFVSIQNLLKKELYYDYFIERMWFVILHFLENIFSTIELIINKFNTFVNVFFNALSKKMIDLHNLDLSEQLWLLQIGILIIVILEVLI